MVSQCLGEHDHEQDIGKDRNGAFKIHRVAPPCDSELAQQVAKGPYAFGFLGLSGEIAERDLEQSLMDRITETLRELGPGFSFVGRQVHFDVDGDDFYIDYSDSRLIPIAASFGV